MKMGYKARLGLLIVGQLVLIVGVTMFSYRPSVAAIDKAEAELRRLSEKQAELCKLVEAHPTPEADIVRTKAEIRQLENRMPPESRVSWLSARIADAMRENHIDMRSATHWAQGGEEPPVAQLKRLQKDITVTGTAQNVQAFLEALNKLPFAVIVEDLRVVRDRKWGDVSADVKLATFVLRTPAAPGLGGSLQ